MDKLSLTGRERLLDIGAGDGRVTAELARRVPSGSVLGIDSSREMVEFARRAFRTGFPNLGFKHMDARRLEFEEEFDVVFSNATLHWVNDHPSVLAGIRRALRPSGHLLIQMGGQGNVMEILAVLSDMIASGAWRRYFSDFTCPYTFPGREEYGALLLEAGLTPSRIELIPKDNVQDGRERLAGFLRTTWHPYINRAPRRRRPEFLDELVSRYAERHPEDEHGRYHVRMVRLEVEAGREQGLPVA
jgi:trans-aconitate methyltransferase